MTCQHGRKGYCYDDATPEQRERFDFLYQHAYDYVASAGRDRDEAEEYAAHYAGLYWEDEEDMTPGHHIEWQRWYVPS